MSGLDSIISTVKTHLELLPENTKLRTWSVAISNLDGRGLFAVSDIMAGDLIYVDHPLIMGPRMSSSAPDGCIVCCSIHKPLETCSRGCGLPVCSSECQNSTSHFTECELIKFWKPKEDRCRMDSKIFAKHIVPVRALLLDPQKKDFLRSLAVHKAPRHGGEVQFIKKFFDISHEEEELMMQACCVLDANAYEMILETDKNQHANLRGLFPVSALLNHTCSPNTRTSFDATGKMCVKASEFISAGSEIFTSYTGLTWGTPARRLNLMNTKHFSCMCTRCCDKTEYGTNLAAMKCLDRTCGGILLPLDPLDFSSSWCCEQCSMRVTPRQVGALQSALAGVLGGMQLDSPDVIYDFINSSLMKFLPEANHIIFELRCKIIWLLGDCKEYHWKELSAEWLRRAESLTRGAVGVCGALRLGGAQLCGRLLLRRHRCLLQLLLRHITPTDTLVLDIEEEIVENINRAYEILKDDLQAPKDLKLRKDLANSSMQKLLEYENKM